MAMVRVSTKGQITIPKALRDELGTGPATYVHLGENGEGAELTVVGEDPVEAAYGMFAHLGPLTQDLLESKREERELEERKLQRWLKPTRK
jgi:AbrB family looped-hinge helix DNA binding protein